MIQDFKYKCNSTSPNIVHSEIAEEYLCNTNQLNTDCTNENMSEDIDPNLDNQCCNTIDDPNISINSCQSRTCDVVITESISNDSVSFAKKSETTLHDEFQETTDSSNMDNSRVMAVKLSGVSEQNSVNSCLSASTQHTNEETTNLTSERTSETSSLHLDDVCFDQDIVNKKSKVIVQVLPANDFAFGSASALKEFVGNSSSAVLFKKSTNFMCKNSRHLDSENFESNDESATASCTPKDLKTEPSKLNCSKTSNIVSRRFMRQRHSFNFHVHRGRGIKLDDIDFISSNLNDSPNELLRILHYILFGSYGLCRNEHLLQQTKQNILLFSGYPFNSDSPLFCKKRNCLLRLPYQILCGIYDALIGKKCNSRPEVVDELLSFLLKPSRHFLPTKCKRKSRKAQLTECRLRELVQQGPSPVVLLEKLSDHYIAEALNQTEFENYIESKDLNTDMNPESYFKPAYILCGPGCKLKMFSKIVTNVQKAGSSVLFLLHHIMYGVTENEEVSKRNILEFSGFSPLQNDFAAERKNILASLRYVDVQNICSILTIQDKSSSKVRKIKKILQFLHRPSPKLRCINQEVMPRKNGQSKCISRHAHFNKSVSLDEIDKPKSIPEECSSLPKQCSSAPKLRDFKNICFNIECATPEDLSELNDLLFVKPCDDSEIHQKVLDFTKFSFNENSFEYHYRKTLMHYMNFCIIRKIAKLLDIPDWEGFSNQQDLSTVTLQFLMEMNANGKPGKAGKNRSNATRNIMNDSKCNETNKDSSLFKCAISKEEKNKSISRSDILNNSNCYEINSDLSPVKNTLSKEEINKSISDSNVLKNSNLHETSSDSSIVTLYRQQTDNTWSYKGEEKDAFINIKSASFDHPYSMHTVKKYHEKKQGIQNNISTCPKTVYIHRITKSAFPQTVQKNANFSGFLSASKRRIHNKVPFNTLLSNPSDKELEKVIQNVMKTNLWSITMNDLLKEVVLHFPMINIIWQSDIIKAKARKILSALQKKNGRALTQYHRFALK